jgi:SAM-dependent methyltransferase
MLTAYGAAYPTPPHPLLAPLAEGLPAFLQKCLATHGPAPWAGAIRRGLDAGCATGRFTGLLARHVELAVGIDLAFDQVRRARELAMPTAAETRPSFLVASADEPVFDDGTFDGILAVNILDATRDPRRLLGALGRTLRPGGLFVLTTPFEYATALTELQDRIEEDELLETLAVDYEVIETPMTSRGTSRSARAITTSTSCARSPPASESAPPGAHAERPSRRSAVGEARGSLQTCATSATSGFPRLRRCGDREPETSLLTTAGAQRDTEPRVFSWLPRRWRCPFIRGDPMAWLTVLVSLGLLLGSSPSLRAAEPEAFRVRSAGVDRPGELSAVVVIPPGGTPPAADFALLLDDRRIAAQKVQDHQLSVMLLVDVSGSMKGAPLADIKDALARVLKKARPQDQYALTFFADRDWPGAPSRDKIEQALSSVKAQGKQTLLYQALLNALQAGPSNDPQMRRILVVLTDGKDEGSQAKLQDVVNESRAKQVPIYAVFRGDIDRSFEDLLTGLANAANGGFYSTHNSGEIGRALEDIYVRETSSVTVRFAYPADPTGRVARSGQVELRQAGGPLRAALPKDLGVAALHVPSPPPAQRPWGWILLLLAILVAALGFWLRRRSRRPSPVREPAPVVEREPEPEPIADVYVPTPSRHRVTQIGHNFSAPASGQPTIILQGISGPAKGQQYAMEREIFSIGAEAQSDLPIFDDAYVSRQHAYLRYERGSLFIYDKASRNGTFVNDTPVSDTGVALRPGDRITCGTSTFEVLVPPG